MLEVFMALVPFVGYRTPMNPHKSFKIHDWLKHFFTLPSFD